MRDSTSLRTDLRLFTWPDMFLLTGNMSLYRVPLTGRSALCSMVPRATFFQHLDHKVSKVEREEAYISF